MDEYRVHFSNQRALCGPCAAENPDGADYVRVIDAHKQLAYSTMGRLRHDPAGEMTRLLDALTDGRPAAEPIDPEWQHPECVLEADTGLVLRCAPAGTTVDYVRVCRPAGTEKVYWSVDEWAEDPELVLGALLGSLSTADPLG